MKWKKRSSGFGGINSTKHGLDRDLLPDPVGFYIPRMGNIKKPDANGWVSGLCPFHTERNPSFRFNMITGAFCCFSCGKRGGDVIAFQMAKFGMTFKAACESLGAWRKK